MKVELGCRVGCNLSVFLLDLAPQCVNIDDVRDVLVESAFH